MSRSIQHVYRAPMTNEHFIKTAKINQNITSQAVKKCGITNFAQVKIHKRTGRKNQ